MSAPSVPYDTFINLPQGFEDAGGPWRAFVQSVNQTTTSTSTQAGTTRMLTTSTFGGNGTTISYLANVTISSSVFGKDQYLPCTLSYTPFFAELGWNPPSTQTGTVVSIVSGNRFTDATHISSYLDPISAPYPNDRITHYVNLAATEASSGNAYVILQLSVRVTTSSAYQFYIQDTEFKILPLSPTSSANTASSSSTASTSPSNSSTPPPDTPSSSFPVGAIAGIVVGTVAIVALLVAWLLFRRRRRKTQNGVPPPGQPQHASPGVVDPRTTITPWRIPDQGHAMSQTSPRSQMTLIGPHSSPPTTFTPSSPPRDPDNAFTSITPYNKASSRPPTATFRPSPNNAFSPSPNNTVSSPTVFSSSGASNANAPESPPDYGTTPSLEAWAWTNRDLIPEDLEERLANARYLPSDNPDIMSEDQWLQRHGVTPLELARLRGLYARRNGRTGL